MQPQVLPQPPHRSRPPATEGIAARVIGWVLLIPAVVLTVLTLFIPTLRTIGTSLQSQRTIADDESTYVGFDNYARLFEDERLWSGLGFALSLVLAPIIVAVVVAPLLAAAFQWAGGWARLTARIALSVTLVVFAPVALAIAWGRLFGEQDPGMLGNVELARGALRLAIGMMTFGVVCAVGVMIFLPVFRAREQRRPMWPALFATAGIAALGLLAIGLQLFTVPLVITGFGPADKTLTPVGLMFQQGFRNLQAGYGTAVGGLLLLFLVVLGVAAVLIVILTRLRVSLLPLRQRRSPAADPALPGPPTEFLPPAGTNRINPGAIVVAALALIALGVAIVLNARPWLDALSGPAPQRASGTQGRTWLSGAPAVLLSVGAAYLAALGISGLRPLGRHSEWLLLPFAPWLFVGAAPLSIEFYLSLQEDGEIGGRGALEPPILISIVSLVILAILCRGQAQRWRQQVAAGAPAGEYFVRTVLLPTLPLAGFLFVVTLFLNAQDLLWPLLVSPRPETGTTPLALFQEQGQTLGTNFSVAAATPLLAVVLGFAALVAIQVFNLDRMMAATGSSDDPAAN